MKILIVDIETSPHLSWHFGRWNQNIQKIKTEKESKIICWAAKWYGKKTIKFKSFWQHGDDNMMEELWNLMHQADVVMGYNSKKFDVKRINTEFVKRGWEQPSPYQQIDLLQQVRSKFNFSSNKLADVLEELGLVPKLEHEGIKLWISVMHGVKDARKRMRDYNKHDVAVTESLYDWIRGWITPHPNVALYVNDEGDEDHPICGTCGSRDMKRHKKRRTKVGLFQQWHCQNCGTYSRGRRNLKKGGVKNGVLA